MLASAVFCLAVSLAQPRFLVFDRTLPKLQDTVDKLDVSISDPELQKLGFEQYELKSGKLFVHQSADRLRQVKSLKELFVFLSSELTDSSTLVNFGKLPKQTLERFAFETPLGYILQPDGEFRALFSLTPSPLIWVEKGDRMTPLQLMSRTDLKEPETEAAVITISNFKERLQERVTPKSVRYWGIGILGKLSRDPGIESALGKLINEYGELLDSELKSATDMQDSLAKRLAEADPWAKQFQAIQEGQSWDAIPDSLRAEIIKMSFFEHVQDESVDQVLTGGKVYRIRTRIRITSYLYPIHSGSAELTVPHW